MAALIVAAVLAGVVVVAILTSEAGRARDVTVAMWPSTPPAEPEPEP